MRYTLTLVCALLYPRAAQHANEAWLSAALAHSPWRVEDPSAADLIYLDGHDFSRWCTASRTLAMRNAQWHVWGSRANETACAGAPLTDHRQPLQAMEVIKRRQPQPAQPPAFAPAQDEVAPLSRDEVSKRYVWRRMLETSEALLPAGQRVPRVVALTSGECPMPYWGRNQKRPEDLIMLVDQAPRPMDLVTPYVVSQPLWLAHARGATERAPPQPPRWEGRKLLFFAGHTPKLTQSATRYLLWKQLRRSPHVTALSSTIGCNVASYHICQSAASLEGVYDSFCRPWCHSQVPCTPGVPVMRRHCKAVLQHVNFTDEWDDLQAAVPMRARTSCRHTAHASPASPAQSPSLVSAAQRHAAPPSQDHPNLRRRAAAAAVPARACALAGAPGATGTLTIPAARPLAPLLPRRPRGLCLNAQDHRGDGPRRLGRLRACLCRAGAPAAPAARHAAVHLVARLLPRRLRDL